MDTGIGDWNLGLGNGEWENGKWEIEVDNNNNKLGKSNMRVAKWK